MANTAPTATNSTISTIAEDITTTSNLGDRVSTLTSGTDSDIGALGGIAVVSVDNRGGMWEFSTDGGGTWSGFWGVGSTTARLLAANNLNHRIRFRPDSDYNGTSTLTYRAWDQTSGTAGSTADVTVNGGTTAFSSNTGTATITINGVNDTPRFYIGIDENTSLEYVSKFGTAGSGNGQINQPHSVAVDSQGNIYITDSANHRIQKFTAAGVYTTKWGSLGSGNGQFNYPAKIAIDKLDQIYVSDYNNHRIQVFDANGTYLYKWGTNGGNNGQFRYPVGMVFDSTGYLWVADADNDRIQKFDRTGNWIASLGSTGTGNGQFDRPYDIAIDGNDNIYVTEEYNDRIQKFTPNGLTSWTWQWKQGNSAGSANGQFNNPFGVASDGFDALYATDFFNHRIQKFTTLTPTFIYKVGGSASSTNGLFNAPLGINTDRNGRIYTTEYSGQRIQIFTTVASSATTAEDTSFSLPIYLTDSEVASDSTLFTTTSSDVTIATASVNYTSGGIGTLTVTPQSNQYGTVTITIRYTDAQGLYSEQQLAVTITAAQDAPVAVDSTANAIMQDVSSASNTGTAISAISPLLTDVDEINGVTTLKGLAIIGATNTNGLWQYSTNGGVSWTGTAALSNTSAMLLAANNANHKVRFVPNAGFYGTATLTYRAWDQTSGTAGTLTNVSTNGDATAYSSNTATLTITVNSLATPTFTPTNTPSATPTATPSATPSLTPTATPSLTPTATPSFTPTATPSATPTATPSLTPTATPSFTPTATPSLTPTATPSFTPTATPSLTPTATPSFTPTATPSLTPTATPSLTPTATPSFTPTATPSFTPTATPSFTPTATPSLTPTATPSATPTATPSFTPTATPSATPSTVTPSHTTTPSPYLQVRVTLRDQLTTDSNRDGKPSPGDTLTYTAYIYNLDTRSITNIQLIVAPDKNSTLIIGSVKTSSGTVTSGNTPLQGRITVTIPTLNPSDYVQITYRTTIKQTLPARTMLLSTQALVSATNIITQTSDDPDTLLRDDATTTLLSADTLIQFYNEQSLFVDLNGNGIANSGDSIHYIARISNNSFYDIREVVFSLPVGADFVLNTAHTTTSQGVISSGATLGDTTIRIQLGTLARGSSATIHYVITIPSTLPATSTQLSNQPVISYVDTRALRTINTHKSDDPATAILDDPTITILNSTSRLVVTKRASLMTDVDGDNQVDPFDIVLYHIRIQNFGSVAHTKSTFLSLLDTKTTLMIGSVQTSQGTVVIGNGAGHASVYLDLGNIDRHDEINISYRARVNVNTSGTITSQAVVSSPGVPDIVTDNPNTLTLNDPTSMRIGAAPAHIMLTSFTAVRTRYTHLIRWSTASEIGTWHFNIYRIDKGVRTRVPTCSNMIATGSPTRGANYQCLLKASSATTYILEEVTRTGGRSFYQTKLNMINRNLLTEYSAP